MFHNIGIYSFMYVAMVCKVMQCCSQGNFLSQQSKRDKIDVKLDTHCVLVTVYIYRITNLCIKTNINEKSSKQNQNYFCCHFMLSKKNRTKKRNSVQIYLLSPFNGKSQTLQFVFIQNGIDCHIFYFLHLQSFCFFYF